jgi:hypothetical protein
VSFESLTWVSREDLVPQFAEDGPARLRDQTA